MAPLCLLLAEDKAFELRVCVTAQHRELLDQATKLFDLKVDHDLDIMTKNQDLIDVTTTVLSGVKSVIKQEEPDIILVHGDTATTMSVAMAGFFMGVPIGHVEAGLRTKSVKSPFPEEFNRRITTIASDYHFAPTFLNKENLITAGIPEGNIFVTGNTVIDAINIILNRINANELYRKKVHGYLKEKIPQLSSADIMILITSHRRENFGAGLKNICSAIRQLADRYPSVKFVFPVHPNASVLKPVKKVLSGIDNIYLSEPLSYDVFCFLLNRSYLVLTDSGGLQEEAPALGKPVLVMRNSTERPEAICAGTARLVGTSSDTIVKHTSELLDNKAEYQNMVSCFNPFGDGDAAKKIAEHLKRLFHNSTLS